MPAVSEKQRKLFGTALSMKRGEQRKTSTPAGKIAETMSEEDIKDFASKSLVKQIDNFIKQAARTCLNCGAKLYGATITPVKCPKCGKPWKEKIEKKHEQFGEKITPTEKLVETREKLREAGIKPPESERTDWRTFLGGRVVERPGSELPKSHYYVGPRGGTSRHTGEPWRPISYRGGAHYVKNLLKSVNNAISKLQDKVYDEDVKNRDRDIEERKKDLAHNISTKATGDQPRLIKSINDFIEKSGPRYKGGKPSKLGEKTSLGIRRLGPGERKRFIRSHKMKGPGTRLN